MKTIYLDHGSLLHATVVISGKNGIIDIKDQEGYVVKCEVDDIGFDALVEHMVPFAQELEQLAKRTTKKTVEKTEKVVEKKETKKNLTSNTK